MSLTLATETPLIGSEFIRVNGKTADGTVMDSIGEYPQGFSSTDEAITWARERKIVSDYPRMQDCITKSFPSSMTSKNLFVMVNAEPSPSGQIYLCYKEVPTTAWGGGYHWSTEKSNALVMSKSDFPSVDSPEIACMAVGKMQLVSLASVMA
jgi:hypothetical protein